MGYIGNEIVQSRTYIDPSAKEPSNLNYKHTFPITVFDAVRESMSDANSQTLRQALEYIYQELGNRQIIIPNLPANYLVTYAGAAGKVGSIEITHSIPWDNEQRSHNKIPTERAIGNLLQKIGLVDTSGNVVDVNSVINWSTIIGKPNTYEELGDNDDGYMTQEAITKAMADLKSELESADSKVLDAIGVQTERLNAHLLDHSNPHQVTAEQIGALPKETFEQHLNADNPHGITAATIGLGNVDNTADIDKPISKATQDALDAIKQLIGSGTSSSEGSNTVDSDTSNCITNLEYTRKSGKMIATYKDGSYKDLDIPINGLIDEIRYDKDRNVITVYELSGITRELDLSNMIFKVSGYKSDTIDLTVEQDAEGTNVIKANLRAGSITEEMLSSKIKLGGSVDDAAVTTRKLADESVTAAKIAERAITNEKLYDRSVDGRALFSAESDNQVLIARKAGSDPVWGPIISDLIADDSIRSKHILDWSVITSKLADLAVTTAKIANDAVTAEKIPDSTITGAKMVWNVQLPGTPSNTLSPSQDATGNELADVSWVREFISNYQFKADQIPVQSIEPEKVASGEEHTILASTDSDGTPEWTKLTGDYLEDKSIASKQIADDAITHLQLADSEVTSEKIFPSDKANRVLAASQADGHPIYTQIIQEMMAENSIGTKQIQNYSVTLNKLESATEDYQVLVTRLRNTNPEWTKISDKMIADRAITGKQLFSATEDNTILTVEQAGNSPEWTKVKQGMLDKESVTSENIALGSILPEHLSDKIFDADKLDDRSITSEKIGYRQVTGAEIFSTEEANRVLAVSDNPYEEPKWTQVTGDMVADESIPISKLTPSRVTHRVLGVRNIGDPVEWLRLTSDFFTDTMFSGSNITENAIFAGTPETTVTPTADSNNKQIANTEWVVAFVQDMINRYVEPTCHECGIYNPMNENDVLKIWAGVDDDSGDDGNEGFLTQMSAAELREIWDSDEDPSTIPYTDSCVCGEMYEIRDDELQEVWDDAEGAEDETAAVLDEHSVDGRYLFTSETTGVLAVTSENGDPEYTKVTNDLMGEEAVDSQNLAPNLELRGRPTVTTRPPDGASDNAGIGSLIPDCQWVLDRIKDAMANISSSGTTSTTTEAPTISESDVTSTWENPGTGDITSEEGELSESDVSSAWSNPNEISGADSGEISADTVALLWDNPDTTEVEDDDTVIVSGSGTSTASGSSDTSIVTTERIAAQAVNGEKLFTTMVPDTVLAVTEIAGVPHYTKISAGMVEDHIVDASKFIVSDSNYTIFATAKTEDGAAWQQLTRDFLPRAIVGTDQIEDQSITGDKFATHSIPFSIIDPDTFDVSNVLREAVIRESHIQDGSITTSKIADQSITDDKIADRTITGSKIREGTILPAYTTVAAHTDYEKRSIRNTILSPNAPKNSRNGDIWFRYY